MQDGKSLPSISLPSNDTPGEARDFNPNDGSYSEPYKYHEYHSYAKSKFYFFTPESSLLEEKTPERDDSKDDDDDDDASAAPDNKQ